LYYTHVEQTLTSAVESGCFEAYVGLLRRKCALRSAIGGEAPDQIGGAQERVLDEFGASWRLSLVVISRSRRTSGALADDARLPVSRHCGEAWR